MTRGAERPRVAVVFNPATRADQSSRRKEEIHAALATRGLDVRWFETTREDPGRGQAGEALAAGAGLVLVSGGDGTVRACVDGLAGSDVPLAMLPGGTGNLLAVNFDIPGDLEGAIEVALNGERRRIDVGAVGDERFVIMAGLGFDAAMIRDANPRTKARLGAMAYVISGLRHLRRASTRFELRLDDGEPFTRVGQGVLVGNLGRLQGGLPVMPDARPDDGTLDVAVLQTRTVMDWLKVAVRVLTRRRRDDAQVETFEARRIDIRCDRIEPTELDGDCGEPTDHLTVEVLPAALLLCVPGGDGGPRNPGRL